MAASDQLLRLEGVVKHFPVQRGAVFRRRVGTIHAVNGVSLEVRRGETLGLVGESGCGKSTLARCITRLVDVTDGKVLFDGRDISRFSRRRMRPLRREIQMIFQDPFSSLNPHRRIGSIIGDPFAIHRIAHGRERKRRVQALMELVGLNPEHFNRFPAEFSGGQRQRIGVARALALHPKLVVCDEPVSALDVSIRAQIVNLLEDLQADLGLTYLFIAHDLSLVRHVSDRIAVMYLGNLVEVAKPGDLISRPRHPYTYALLSAVPKLEGNGAPHQRLVLAGEVPSPLDPPAGCPFHPRCPKARPRCAVEAPRLEVRPGDAVGHQTACHYPVEPGEDPARSSVRPADAPEHSAG